MASRTLYVTDMDGTLLNNGSYVSYRSSAILSDLSYDGALITVATARTPATVVSLMETTFTTVPYVVLTGAALYDHASSAYLDINYMPPEDCRLLLDIYAQAGINPFVYHLVDGKLVVYHTPGMTDVERNFYTPRSNLPLKRFTFEHLPTGDDANVLLLFSTGHRKEMYPLADAIRATGRFSVSCYPDIFIPDVVILEIYSVGVSKANAISRLMQTTGAERLVAFGDNLNDIPMLDIADVAVAVANANQRVKERADIVIGPNYDDAVARFILHDYYNH